MAIDYVAMLDRKDLGATLDERFVAAVDFHARNKGVCPDMRAITERIAAKEIERQRREDEYNRCYAERKAADMAALSPQWQEIETAPTDGTDIIGLAWDDGICIAQVAWGDGKWRLVNHPGYDLEGDELQPSHWMAI